MKKVISLVLVLILSICLCACANGNTSTPSLDDEAATASLTETEPGESLSPEQDAPIFIDSEKITPEDLDKIIVEQGNRHGLNSFCYDSSWIYGPWAGKNYTGEVVKVRFDNSDWTVIDSNTNGRFASCHAVEGGYIYYSHPTSDCIELVKVRSSGDDAKVIVAELQGPIQIVDNFIYYTSPELWNDDYTSVLETSAHLYRCDLDGENVEPIIETPVYYFTVFGDYVLYQDDNDNATLHIYDMTSGENIRITNHRSFWPIYDGEFIYYTTDETSPELYQHKLWRISPDGNNNEEIILGCYLGGLLMRGDYIYYINMDDSARIYRCLKDGSEIELVSQDANVSAFQWVNSGLAYVTLDDDGNIDGIFLCDADGANRIEFCKSNDYWYFG